MFFEQVYNSYAAFLFNSRHNLWSFYLKFVNKSPIPNPLKNCINPELVTQISLYYGTSFQCKPHINREYTTYVS